MAVTAGGSRREVAVLGAGLAGMTAAHHLRDRDLVVLEAGDRVGGRAFSGSHDPYWFNRGAQYVWDQRTLDLCRDLGLDVIGAERARTAVFVRDRLVQARRPSSLLLKLPLSLTEKGNFARTVIRLRREAERMEGLDPELDRRSLADVFGRASPITRKLLELVAESGTGIPASEVSGAIGLGYVIHLFGGDVNQTLKAVRGGTQGIAEAVAARLGPDRVALNAVVESVTENDRGVDIRYRRDGAVEHLKAATCVCALPADAVLEAVAGLPDAKRTALERMVPYARILSMAWLTDEDEPMPWDRLLSVPAVGLSFELFSNNAFFARAADGSSRTSGGTVVTLATGERSAALWGLDDEEVKARQAEDLARMFPEAGDVFRRARTVVTRWRGLPRFNRGWLARQAAVREPSDRIFYCGDYTAQPGTPGAVNSGFHAAAGIRQALEAGRR